MRLPQGLLLLTLTAGAVVMTGAAAAPMLQPGGGATQPRAYRPVSVKLPAKVPDPTFEAFRNQLADVAKKRDREALTKLVVAQGFFWLPDEGKDVADGARSGFDNLANAIGLDDGSGWDLVSTFAVDATGDPDPERNGVICGPGDPDFNVDEGVALLNATGTDIGDWVFPASDGIEVRAEPSSSSQVIGRLGLQLIWVYPDNSPASAVQGDAARIVLPTGQLGFVAVESLLTLDGDQICYVKDGGDWKIAGLKGGESNMR